MQQLIEEKGITNLYHFTNVDNLDSIFKYGLVPRSNLRDRKISFNYNDEYRYDGCSNALCMSIEFPNYKMFYSLRMNNLDYKWAVLALEPTILLQFRCAYCWTNAADLSVSSIPIEQRMGKEAFLELFADRNGYPKRESLNIPESYPTNPQAEVLVFGTIPVNYVKNVYFQTDPITQLYQKMMPNTFSFKTDNSKFEWRRDYASWRDEVCSNGKTASFHGVF